ncbi:MAG: DUF1330 domain-containing protein [Gemmatimonadota bacterium]|nr:DUF1330 domain-containing protein [Gemmatimonadota bacterium]
MTEGRPAYLIASSFMPEGHGALDDYAHASHPLIEAAGGEVLVAGHVGQFMDHYEGSWAKDARVTIFRFPSMAALQGFWHSPEYQAIKHLRTDVIPPNFTFAVEGFELKDLLTQNPELTPPGE